MRPKYISVKEEREESRKKWMQLKQGQAVYKTAPT